LHHLTDAQTVEALALHRGWPYALDIRSDDDAYLCERTLRNYRPLLIERQLDQVLFRSLTDRLMAAVGVDARKQRLDSTAIRSAIRGLTRLGILVETVSQFLRQWRRCHPDLHQQVPADLIRRYVEREGPGCFAEAACGACPRQRDGCAAAGRRREACDPYTPERVRQRARRVHDQTEAFRDRSRCRAGVEGTMARSKHQVGMGRLRVRGLKAVRDRAFVRALGLNIHRVAA
jgi:hypothetical protein